MTPVEIYKAALERIADDAINPANAWTTVAAIESIARAALSQAEQARDAGTGGRADKCDECGGHRSDPAHKPMGHAFAPNPGPRVPAGTVEVVSEGPPSRSLAEILRDPPRLELADPTPSTAAPVAPGYDCECRNGWCRKDRGFALPDKHVVCRRRATPSPEEPPPRTNPTDEGTP